MKGPRRRQRESFLPWVLLAVDVAVAYSVLHAAFWIRFESGWIYAKLSPQDYRIYYNVFHLVVLLAVVALQQNGLYRSSKAITFGNETLRVLKAFFAVSFLLAAMSFFIRPFSFSRTFLLMAGVSLVTFILIARYVASLVIMNIDKERGSFRNVLVVGSDENVEKIIQFYRKNERLATKVDGLLDSSRPKGSLVSGVPVRGSVDDLPELLKKEHQVHEVLLADPGFSEDQTLKILYECEKEMVDFKRVADLFGLISSKMKTSYVAGVPVLSFSESPLLEWENRVLKRTMDVVLSVAGLVVLSPLFLVLAIAVRASSRGPVFFKQKRVGQDGRQFSLYKFRTMQANAEEATGPVWAKENDERRTKLGAFLRQNNLDELPQLFNVLRGDMSLVGPRPERPFFASQFKEDIPRYMARHSIRSGMSGWAQVNGLRGNTSIEERTKYDLYYIENWSLLLDVKILFLTFFARRNAY